ncbi:MAG TPA: HlyD family efflux transporter periplasmic adaptor subunit [Saprospiraceae bacterium]|nr:HlyD family efflux transporter periplasmic adaptor subunit [Saprospiraceae bacterium]
MPETIYQQEEHLAIEHIFGKPPGWILHWGISISTLFLLVCLGIAAFVKYPDKMRMQGHVVSARQPIVVSAKMDGIIEKITAPDKSRASSQQAVVFLRSTLNKDDLAKFTVFADQFNAVTQNAGYQRISIPENLVLGELTPTYTEIVQQFRELQNFLGDHSVFVKTEALEKEIVQIYELNNSLGKQGTYYEADMALTEKDFQRNQSLQNDGVLAPVDKEKAESKLINEKRNLEAFRSNIINNNVRIQQLKTQISDLYAENRNGSNSGIAAVRQLIDRLQGEIREWDDRHRIVAPIDGVVSFERNWSENQFVKSGEPLFTVIPDSGSQDYFVSGSVPVRASGNLKTGQSALIEIENYPAGQYGMLRGEVTDIALIPTEENYRVTIKLPSSLETTYKKELPKNQLMKANVSINTQDYSLLERLFQNLYDLAKNR